MSQITAKRRYRFIWWINADLHENGTPTIGIMSCTRCPTSYQLFDGGIYPLCLTENFQNINIENQPMTYDLWQICLLTFIRLKDKIKDPFYFSDEWFPSNVTIGRFTLVTNAMFWGVSIMQFSKSNLMKGTETEPLSVYDIFMHTPIKGSNIFYLYNN